MPPTPLLASVQRILAQVAGLLGTHLELFGLELQDALQRFAVNFILGVLSVVLGGLCLALAAVLLLIIFWDSHRIAVALGLMLVYGGAAIGFAAYLRHRLKHAADLFPATCGELARDRKALLHAEDEA
ncbi:phage holin family protein [Janthinobacterium sp. B9-8]|uniref:phage holin family protein n=1 Tax=Janthinobacterium sp. B9-8 TaxID=1236179 RepID=UPI00061CDD1D|nr:phage holin family protein [Janthinobacterium sp. B9-8]